MNSSDTSSLQTRHGLVKVARSCRVCGRPEVSALPIGVYAPFFQLRVDIRRDRFALWTTAGGIEAPPDFRHAHRGLRRILRAVKRRVKKSLGLVGRNLKLLRTECHWCDGCGALTPAHEFTLEELVPLYSDYRSASYNRDRISVEPSYAALASRVGADIRERESRNSGVAGFVLPHLTDDAGSGTRALDLGGSDGRFIPTELISRYSQIHIVDTSDATIDPSLSGRVLKVAAADGAYDMVMCMHVLEHVGHPRDFVKHALQYLRPGGFIYLEVPLELDPKISEQFRNRAVDGTVIFHEHINQFDSGSLARLIESIEGLELVATEAAHIDCGWTQGHVARTLARRVA